MGENKSEKRSVGILFIFALFVIILIILGNVMPNATTETNNSNIATSADIDIDMNITNDIDTNFNTYTIPEYENIKITNLKFNETEIELDIKETKNIILEVIPDTAAIEDLELCTTDSTIATLEKSNVESIENKITLTVKPIAEGSCEVFAKSTNEIMSNKVTLKIIDNERIERERKEKEEQERIVREEQLRKEAEEQAKREKEEQLKKEQDAQAAKAAKEKETQKSTTQSKTTTTKKTTSSSQSTNSNNTHGKEVYRTPSGKRYHFDPDCGGKNSYKTTLDAAKSAGLTPCKKCAS